VKVTFLKVRASSPVYVHPLTNRGGGPVSETLCSVCYGVDLRGMRYTSRYDVFSEVTQSVLDIQNFH
jgi:hypothetical protein